MSNLVPGIFITISDLASSTPSTGLTKVLLIGMKLSTGTLAAHTPLRVFSESDALAATGEGSQLIQMYRAARRTDPTCDITIVAVIAPVSAAATGTFTVVGTTTTATPLILQVEDETITVPLAIGDDQTDVATKIEAAIDAVTYLHVTSAFALGVVTVTARSHGIHGNGIWLDVKQPVPPGITVARVAMSGGTGSPDVDGALQSLGGVRYNYIVLPDTGATNLDDVTTYLDARWLANSAIDGHAIVGVRDTLGNLATLGLGLDTKHLSVFGEPSVPSNPWVQAAAIAALRWKTTNPNLSLYDFDLVAITAPDETQYLNPDDRNTLLVAGIATYHYVSGNVRVDRFVTAYKTNGLGQPSDALLDAETKFTVSAMRQERMRVLLSTIGKILVPDAAAVSYDLETATVIIDPEGIAELLRNQYEDDFQKQGWVSEVEGFKAGLVVSLASASRVTFYTPDTINGTLYRIEGSMEFKKTGS